MLLGWHLGIGPKLCHIGRPLVIEFNQNHRTLHPVIEPVIDLHAADPAEPCVVDMPVDFIHLQASVSVVHITGVKPDQVAQASPCRIRQLVRAQAGIVQHHVVLEGLAKVVIACLGEAEHGLPALRVGQCAKHLQAVVLLLLQDDYPFLFSRRCPNRLRS